MWEARAHTLVTPYASIETVEGVDPEAGADASLLVEAKLLWGRDTIGVRHVAARATLCVRDLGLDVPSRDDLVIGETDDAGAFTLRLPNGIAVPAGCRMTLRMGRALLRLSLVPDDVAKLPRPRPDARTAFGILAAAALHIVLLGLVAHSRADEGALADGARETMQRMVASAEERALAELAAAQEKSRAETALGVSAPTPDEERAAAGNPSKTTDVVARARATHGETRRVIQPEHEEAATFGLIAMLSTDSAASRVGSSAFAAESGPSAMGNIFGQTIDDAAGLGGLGLTGPGQGGGGHGAGVKLASIGTIGRTAGAFVGQGLGAGAKPLRREHEPRTYSMVWGGGSTTQVTGRLMPESVQRTVRQGFGRFRACYEAGLARTPDLEGRVAVKFVIARDGEVALASPWSDTTLPDAAVVQCVTRAFQSLTFSQPEGGIVTVVYPIVFTRTSP